MIKEKKNSLLKTGIKKYNLTNKKLEGCNFKGVGLNSDLGRDKIAKILTLYSDLNHDWLLAGKGEMTRAKVEKRPVYKEVIEHPINIEMVSLLNEKSKEIGKLEAKVEMMAEQITELREQLQQQSSPSIPRSEGKTTVRVRNIVLSAEEPTNQGWK